MRTDKRRLYPGKRWLLVTAIIAVLAVPVSSRAATFLVNQQGTVTTTGEVADDLYVVAQTVTVKDKVSGDVFVVAPNVDITANVNQDVYAAGKRVTITAPVNDDVHVAGQSVVVGSSIDGDLFAAGQSIEIDSAVTVGGTVYTAGDVTIRGHVMGSVRASGQVELAPGAVINGDLLTYGDQEPVIAEGASVLGTRRHHPAKELAEPTTRSRITNWLRRVATVFVASLILLYLLPVFTRRVLGMLGQRPGRSVVTGLLWLVLFIPAAIILLMTVIGLPIALTLLLATFLLPIVAAPLASLGLGAWVMTRLTRARAGDIPSPAAAQVFSWQHALLGAVIYESVKLLGGIGWIADAILVLFAIGALILTVWDILRGKSE